MADPQDQDDCQKLFASHFRIIERVVGFVSRRNHLAPEEAEDFGSHTNLRLLEGDCAALRQFRGGSNIQSYLSVVIERFFLDYRRHAWGKWRPSAEASRLGPEAVLLDRLLSRDGYTVDQAYELMTTNQGIRMTRAEVEQLAAALPQRHPRRFESDEHLTDKPAQTGRADAVVEHEAVESARGVAAALQGAFGTLTVQDRLVLVMRFHDGHSVAHIAAALGLDQKALYRRIERQLKTIRQHLEQQGIDKSRVLEILGSERASFELARNLPEIADAGPSLSVGAGEW